MSCFCIFLSIIVTALLVSGQQIAIPGPRFLKDPHAVIVAAAPSWGLDINTCFPSDATDGKGGPNEGLPADHCNIFKINHNCPPRPKQNGPNTDANRFPTYYTMRYCPDQTWRIVYDVYFPKDTGHRHDWEWAAVKFIKQSGDIWVRDGIWMEQDGDTPYTSWSDLSTYFNDDDINEDGQNKDHAHLYFGKWHHSVHQNTYLKAFAQTWHVPPNSVSDYRSNDYRWPAAKWLVDGSVIDPTWKYGNADSTPGSFLEGGKHDVCKL